MADKRRPHLPQPQIAPKQWRLTGLRGGDRVHQRSPPLPDPEPSDAARASEGFGLRSPDIGPEMTDQRDAKHCRPVSLEPP
jgi:hypothetical protein